VVQGFGIVCSQCRRLNAEKSAACENCQKTFIEAKPIAAAASRPAIRAITTPPKPLTTLPKPSSTQNQASSSKPLLTPSKLQPAQKPSESKLPAVIKPAATKNNPIQANNNPPPETIRLQPEPYGKAQSEPEKKPSVSSAAHGRFSALLQTANARGDFDDALIGDWIEKRGVSENTVNSLDTTSPSFLEAFQQEVLEESKINGPRENQSPIEPPMERRDQIICTNCGAIIHPGHKFCGKCGTSIEEITAKRPPTDLFGPLQQVGKAKLYLIK
jgi:hypothetical protein